MPRVSTEMEGRRYRRARGRSLQGSRGATLPTVSRPAWHFVLQQGGYPTHGKSYSRRPGHVTEDGQVHHSYAARGACVRMAGQWIILACLWAQAGLAAGASGSQARRQSYTTVWVLDYVLMHCSGLIRTPPLVLRRLPGHSAKSVSVNVVKVSMPVCQSLIPKVPTIPGLPRRYRPSLRSLLSSRMVGTANPRPSSLVANRLPWRSRFK